MMKVPQPRLLILAACFLTACGQAKGKSGFAANDAAREVAPPADGTVDAVHDVRGDGDALADDGGLPLGPPLQLPGASLWLDGDVGLVRDGDVVRTWADRSGQGHIFQAQAAGALRPGAARVGGHGAVRFDGRNRMIIEPDPTQSQMDGLTFAQGGFLMAIVFQAETLRDDRPPLVGAFLVSAQAPWIAEIPQANVILSPTDSHVVSLFASHAGISGAVNAGPFVRSPGDYSARSPHLALIKLSGTLATLRVDNGAETRLASALSADANLLYAPLYIGGWDFDQPGFDGEIAEVVFLKGAPSDATVATLRTYLMDKFQIPR